ncbi:MAG TPA: MBL fold metallo-hydrolase, partial [Panacibacter sp.]|nr:MBL fold metallo-hydrolase [Panacibacter sp.]
GGHCEPRPPGGRLINGEKEARLCGEEFREVSEVGSMCSMSAPVDYDDLWQFLACQDTAKVKQVFIVHGEYDVQIEFQNRLMKKGFRDVVVPDLHEEIKLAD